MKIIGPHNTYELIADKIELGKNVTFGTNISIRARGLLRIGDFSHFSDGVDINAEEVIIGKHFYHYTSGLKIGGGGSQFSGAILDIGDRCVLHNNYINLAQPVSIGNDVGLSPDVQLITHGFWNSILEGYPTKYAGIDIKSGVIVGQRSMILPGTVIPENSVIGAQSVVGGKLHRAKSVYAGNPARFIREIKEPSLKEKQELFNMVMLSYIDALYMKHEVDTIYYSHWLHFDYPNIYIDDAVIDVKAKTIKGIETTRTDKLRDFLRRYGIRIYTERPFVSI